MNTNTNIIYNLIVISKKFKIKYRLYKYNTIQITLLEYLWQNHFIYGFTRNNNLKQKYITIFLKYNQFGSSLIASSVFKQKNTIKNLKQLYKWSKNSCFILKTKKGFINLKLALIKKIGGFILHKIY